jgi:hypothetical protein
MGLSLPSNCTEKPYARGFPSAETPSNVYFTPSPCASTVRVRLCGGGPGTYFDFARLSFQVPTSGLPCARRAQQPTTVKTAIATNRNTCFMDNPPWVRSFTVWLLDFIPSWKFTGFRPVGNNSRHNMMPRPSSQLFFSYIGTNAS